MCVGPERAAVRAQAGHLALARSERTRRTRRVDRLSTDGTLGFRRTGASRMLPCGSTTKRDEVPEGIDTWTEKRALEALEETAFATEDELQALIAIIGRGADSARRCAALGAHQGGKGHRRGCGQRCAVGRRSFDRRSGRRADTRGVKRGSNPEVRRTIVGQMLEYAAHAAEAWTVEELREGVRGRRDRGWPRCGRRACGAAGR